jgi:hypothetical protein
MSVYLIDFEDGRGCEVESEYVEISESGALCFYNQPGESNKKTLQSVSGEDNLICAYNDWLSVKEV